MLEIEGRSKVESEDAVVGCALGLLLGLMEWQGTEVVGLRGIYLQRNGLDVDLVVGNHSEATFKVFCGVPVVGHTEGVLCLVKVCYAIKGIDARSFLAIIRIGAASHHIPALTEELDAVRLHVEVVFLLFPVAVVGDVKHTIFLHCLEDGLKIGLPRGNILQEYAVVDALAT